LFGKQLKEIAGVAGLPPGLCVFWESSRL